MVHQPISAAYVRPPRVVKRKKQVNETFLSDGLISSFTHHDEFEEFGDETFHFRDFSLQSIVKAQAVELLKPLGSLPYDALKAADVLTSAVGNFENLHDEAITKIADLARHQNQSSPVEATKNSE